LGERQAFDESLWPLAAVLVDWFDPDQFRRGVGRNFNALAVSKTHAARNLARLQDAVASRIVALHP
jgi:hypothetical protein